MAHVTSARDNTTGDGLPRIPSIPLTDDAAFEANGSQSIGHLVKDATTHLSTLIRAEVELARGEIAREVKKALVGSIFFIAALVVALYSSFFLFFWFADILDIWLPRWIASGIVFVGMLLISLMFVLLGRRRLKKIRAPERTITSIKETAAALAPRRDEQPEPETSAVARSS
jgi:hypothetical protein